MISLVNQDELQSLEQIMSILVNKVLSMIYIFDGNDEHEKKFGNHIENWQVKEFQKVMRRRMMKLTILRWSK